MTMGSSGHTMTSGSRHPADICPAHPPMMRETPRQMRSCPLRLWDHGVACHASRIRSAVATTTSPRSARVNRKRNELRIVNNPVAARARVANPNSGYSSASQRVKDVIAGRSRDLRQRQCRDLKSTNRAKTISAMVRPPRRSHGPSRPCLIRIGPWCHSYRCKKSPEAVRGLGAIPWELDKTMALTKRLLCRLS